MPVSTARLDKLHQNLGPFCLLAEFQWRRFNSQVGRLKYPQQACSGFCLKRQSLAELLALFACRDIAAVAKTNCTVGRARFPKRPLRTLLDQAKASARYFSRGGRQYSETNAVRNTFLDNVDEHSPFRKLDAQ